MQKSKLLKNTYSIIFIKLKPKLNLVADYLGYVHIWKNYKGKLIKHLMAHRLVGGREATEYAGKRSTGASTALDYILFVTVGGRF